jgi:hypothetical protein
MREVRNVPCTFIKRKIIYIWRILKKEIKKKFREGVDFSFETVSCYIDQAGFPLAILLSQPLEC